MLDRTVRDKQWSRIDLESSLDYIYPVQPCFVCDLSPGSQTPADVLTWSVSTWRSAQLSHRPFPAICFVWTSWMVRDPMILLIQLISAPSHPTNHPSLIFSMRKVDLYFSDLSQVSYGARTQFFPKIINPVSDKISNANQLWSIKAGLVLFLW